MAAAAALSTWGTSAWLQASEAKITFRGATSTAFCGSSERKNKFHEGKDLIIPLVVGVAACGVSKFLVCKFLALMLGGAVGWQMYKRLQEAERRRLQEEKEGRRNKRAKEGVSSALGVCAFAGVAALAASGISKSFNGDDGLGPDGETSSDNDKMMKAPGRDYYMPRKDFEKSPSAYFRRLRGKQY